jgi:hypothetical protein
MLKNRAYMSGLGLGLIVGAILLQLMLAANAGGKNPIPAPSGTAAPDEMDPKQLKDAASKYYQLFDKNVKVYTQAEVDAKVQEALKSQPQGGMGGTAGKQIAVYISQGLIASQVAELLYRSGVIADRNAFEKLLNDQQITNKIQVGYHVFEGTTDPQEVIKVLTSSQ